MTVDGQVPAWIDRWFNGWSPTLYEIRHARRSEQRRRLAAERARIWGA